MRKKEGIVAEGAYMRVEVMMQNEPVDKVLEALERFKRWVLAAFLLLAAIIVMGSLLLLEAGVVKKIWGINFASGVEASSEGASLSSEGASQRCSCSQQKGKD
jgi:hypothetical protein